MAHDGETALTLLRAGAFEFTFLDENLPRRKGSAVAWSVDDADWNVLPDVVIDAFGKQCDLLAVIAFNESLHESTGLNALIQCRRPIRFHTPLAKASHVDLACERPFQRR